MSSRKVYQLLSFLLWLSILQVGFVVVKTQGTLRSPAEQRDREWCFAAREKYGIVPGKSFGSLPFNEHNTYLRARCYRFFCKPHALAGKGVFECEPLPDSQTLR